MEATALEPRMLSAQAQSREAPQENALRPKSFDELIGQKEVVANLKVFAQAAKERGQAMDHLLLCGPPGLGKTTIAHIVATELNASLHITSGPAIERKDLAGLLSRLQEGDVLFIDEIHRLNAVVEEILYPAMEDFKFDLIYGQGPYANTVQVPLPPFTLVGATTRTGLLTGPMRDRFGIVSRLGYYDTDELCRVVKRSSGILEIPCDDDGAVEIARRARGTPRIANRLLRRVRDFAQVEGKGTIDLAIANHALGRLGVDENGFDEMDRRFLEALVRKFDGGPVGVDTLAAALGEESDTLESVYEPYLLQEGYLQRTPRGRVATPRSYELVGVAQPPDKAGQTALF